MTFSMQRFAACAIACVALICVAGTAPAADDYPNHPVRWLVGYPPGGSTDIVSRLIGQYLSEHMGQQFVIENKPGAGNNLATEMATRADPDGYIRYCWSIPPTLSTPRSIRTCRSISSATWRRSRVLSACRT